MRVRVLLALAGCLLVGAGAPKKTSLLGSWAVTACDVDGQEVPPAIARQLKMVVKADRMTFAPPLEINTRSDRPGHTFRVVEGDALEARYKLGAAGSPGAIDLTVQYVTGGPEQTVRGVFVLEGDTLKLCLCFTSKERPKKYPAKPQSGVSRFILKRGKR